jgi:phosphoglycerol transferase MdoB-like AlkP superfamily enzyme
MFRPKWLRWPWLWGAVLAYYLPWVVNPAAALTFNAYDLAEWTSLPPSVRGGSIPLLAPFLLRGVLGLLALLFGLRALQHTDWQRWLHVLLALGLAITLMPPLDFFRGTFDDANYRQQFALGIGTLTGLVVLAALAGRWLPALALRRIEAGIAALAMVSALAGEILAQGVVRSFNIPAPLGVGVVAFVACLGLAGLAALHGTGDAV